MTEQITVPAYTADQPVIVQGATTAGKPVVSFSVTSQTPTAEDTTIDVSYTQIQYTQTVLLNFNHLTWPHVSVATLVPNEPVPVTLSADGTEAERQANQAPLRLLPLPTRCSAAALTTSRSRRGPSSARPSGSAPEGGVSVRQRHAPRWPDGSDVARQAADPAGKPAVAAGGHRSVVGQKPDRGAGAVSRPLSTAGDLTVDVVVSSTTFTVASYTAESAGRRPEAHVAAGQLVFRAMGGPPGPLMAGLS